MSLESKLQDALMRRAESVDPDKEIGWNDLSGRMKGERSVWSPVLGGLAVLVVLVGVTWTFVARGRDDSNSTPQASASCPNIAIFEHETYIARHAVVHPSQGNIIGSALLPACNDSNNQPSVASGEYVDVALLPGVSPNRAIVDATTDEVIYVREGVNPLSSDLERYFVAPACDETDAPITMSGTWLTIAQPDGGTELDLHPPYDLGVLVQKASSPGYLGTELLVRVPKSLGEPVTHRDLASSLWVGGSLTAVVTCEGSRFVASSVRVYPP